MLSPFQITANIQTQVSLKICLFMVIFISSAIRHAVYQFGFDAKVHYFSLFYIELHKFYTKFYTILLKGLQNMQNRHSRHVNSKTLEHYIFIGFIASKKIWNGAECANLLFWPSFHLWGIKRETWKLARPWMLGFCNTLFFFFNFQSPMSHSIFD